MNEKRYKYEMRFLRCLERAYKRYDIEWLEDLLADDFTYDSTWVFATLHGPKAYFEYLEGKLATQKKSNYKCNFCLVEDVCSGRPILLLLPRTPEGDYGCFVVDCNEKGKATSLNIMPSIFYKWKPIDEDEYAAFVASEK